MMRTIALATPASRERDSGSDRRAAADVLRSLKREGWQLVSFERLPRTAHPNGTVTVYSLARAFGIAPPIAPMMDAAIERR